MELLESRQVQHSSPQLSFATVSLAWHSWASDIAGTAGWTWSSRWHDRACYCSDVCWLSAVVIHSRSNAFPTLRMTTAVSRRCSWEFGRPCLNRVNPVDGASMVLPIEYVGSFIFAILEFINCQGCDCFINTRCEHPFAAAIHLMSTRLELTFGVICRSSLSTFSQINCIRPRSKKLAFS